MSRHTYLAFTAALAFVATAHAGTTLDSAPEPGRLWMAITGLAVVAAQPAAPSSEGAVPPTPEIGIAVGAGLLLAVAATLVLGIAPGATLQAAQSGAHTLQAPAPASQPPPIAPIIESDPQANPQAGP